MLTGKSPGEGRLQGSEKTMDQTSGKESFYPMIQKELEAGKTEN